jgi:hypothetical protein
MIFGTLLAFVLVAGSSPSAAQTCLHGPDETGANRDRRERALQFAARINAAQAVLSPTPEGRFAPLAQLRDIGWIPPGFHIQFLTDRRRYAFVLKDTRDPCHYAIFSDQDGRIYEAAPTRGGWMVPVMRFRP